MLPTEAEAIPYLVQSFITPKFITLKLELYPLTSILGKLGLALVARFSTLLLNLFLSASLCQLV